MRQGSCALCLQRREIHKSHVIPNSIFRRVKRRYAGRLISLDDSETGPVQYTADSWCDYLLCADCEGWLSVHEKVSIETLRGSPNGIAHWHADGVTFNGFCYQALKLFFTSLLWRAAVSSLDQYSKVILPPVIAEELRSSLYSAIALPPSQLGCRLVALYDPTPEDDGGFSAESIKEFVLSPIPRVQGRCVSFIYVFEGYMLEIYVPRIPPKVRAQHGVLKRNRVWYVPKLSIFEIEEVVRLLVSGYRKAELGLVTFER